MDKPPTIKGRRSAMFVMVVIFITTIMLPLMDSVFHFDRTSNVNENRALATFPRFRWGYGEMRSYFSSVARYYNDNFGFRKRLIHWGYSWKRQWFNETLRSGAIIGQKGWLYGAESLGLKTEGHRMSTPFTPQELQGWQAVFEARREWLNQRSIHYLVVIPPEKHSIYPENLPEWVQKPNTAAKLEQFLAHMKAHSTVELVALHQSLIQAKKGGLVYHLTDTHWNQLGAFAACNEIVQTLSSQMVDLKLMSLDSFEMTITNAPGGNLAWLLTSAESMRESNFPVLSPRPPLQVLETTSFTTNWGIIHHINNPTKTRRALFFNDSFGEGLLPFIGQHFNEVFLYRVYDRIPTSDKQSNTRHAHVWMPSIIEDQKPDVVIDEILESLLFSEDPGYILRHDSLK